MNKAILIGNVGQTPEVKQINAETKVAEFSVATTEKYNGEEKTEWHNVKFFGKIADVIESYVTKGSKVCVVGKITKETWGENNENHKTVIIGRELELLNSKPKDYDL